MHLSPIADFQMVSYLPFHHLTNWFHITAQTLMFQRRILCKLVAIQFHRALSYHLMVCFHHLEHIWPPHLRRLLIWLHMLLPLLRALMQIAKLRSFLSIPALYLLLPMFQPYLLLVQALKPLRPYLLSLQPHLLPLRLYFHQPRLL